MPSGRLIFRCSFNNLSPCIFETPQKSSEVTVFSLVPSRPRQNIKCDVTQRAQRDGKIRLDYHDWFQASLCQSIGHEGLGTRLDCFLLGLLYALL